MVKFLTFSQVSFRVPVTIGAILLALIGVGAWLAGQKGEAFVMQGYRTDSFGYAQIVQQALEHTFVANNLAELEQVVTDLGTEPEVRLIRILDTQGKVLASSIPPEVGVRLSNQSPQCRACHLGKNEPLPSQKADSAASGAQPLAAYLQEPGRLITAAPLENQVTCQACHSGSQATLGIMLIEHSSQVAEQRIGELRFGIGAAAVVLFFTLFGTIWASYEWLVGRPLHRLSRSVSASENGKDDFSRLADHLQRLEQSVEEKDSLLEDQRVKLNALLSLSEWIDVTQSKERLMQFAVSKVREVTGYTTVAMRLFDPQQRCFHLIAQSGMTASMVESLKCIPMDFGFFKDICTTHRAAYTSDLANDERLASPAPLEVGMRSLISVPLLSGERIMGSMELVTNELHLWTEDKIRWLELVGRSLGNGLHHIETTERLRNLAVIQERSLIAQEMHDGLAQLLNSLRLWVENAQLALKEDNLREVEDSIQNIDLTARDASTSLRDEILGLRAANHPAGGILPAIQEYINRYRRQWGIETTLQMEPHHGQDGLRQLSQAAEIQLLRIVQEGLTNIRRHANASHVVVRLRDNVAGVTMEIQDDGRGFDPTAIPDEKLGLRIIRERVASVGGMVTVESASGKGTRMIVEIPKIITTN
jgi:nitrate/nitrite-specific signal transduction histidine kinase